MSDRRINTRDRRRYDRRQPRNRGQLLGWKLFAVFTFVGVVAFLVTQFGWRSPANATDRGEWLTVPPQSLIVDAGSPLDFSGDTPAGAAGAHGALTLTGGRLAFSGQSTPARFNCGMLGGGNGQSVALPSHEEADALAVQLKRHGYTLMRLHNVDYRLLRSARAAGDVDPDALDRFYYLTAALKRNGIYWMADVLSQPSAGLAGSDFGHGAAPDDLRVRLNFDPAARATWLRFVDRVYGSRNPYTGKPMLADPAMAFMVGANENSLGFAGKPDRPFPTGLSARFDAWLHQRFPTPAQLGAAIPTLDDAEKAGKTPVAPPHDWNDSGQRMNFFLLFASDLELDTYRWMTTQLQQRGFHGPLLADDAWYKQLDNRTRARLPIIDVHAYIGEVTSLDAGAQFKLPSITEDAGLGALLINAGARWLDRPMVESEYSAPYPNPYRYEGGLIFPALAAFQGYSTICRTAFLPVETEIPPAELGGKPLRAYSAGLDPNERAQETLSAKLFYRGDVRPATHIVAVSFGEPEFERTGAGFLPLPVRRAALLARFGLIAPDKLATLPGAIAVPVGPVPTTTGGKIVGRVSDMVTGSAAAQTQDLVDRLRGEGALRPGNRTDAAAGLFQSETGEITVDQRRGMIAVITPRTEAVSVTDAATALQLGRMSVRSVNAGALVAATALDDMPLASSRRILFIMTGDTKSSGMQLAGDPRAPRLIDWGRLPILMRRVVATVDLKTGSGSSGKLTVLSLQGKPLSTSTVSGSNGVASLRLDTGAVLEMPTTYFLYEPTP